MKIDSKKLKSLLLTYFSLSLPIATVAFGMDATTPVKIFSFISGLLAVIIRQVNPNDPFTANILSIAKIEIDAEIVKKSGKK
jgi:hypothetical protein